MRVIAHWLLTGILGFLSALHVYWAAGGRWANQATVPRRVGGEALFQPGVVATLCVALLLLVGALVVVMPRSPGITILLLRGMAVIFALRALGDFRYIGFFKSVVNSPFAWRDTRLYSPLCLLIAALAIIASTRR